MKPTSVFVAPSRRLLRIRLPGKEWRCVWRAIDANGYMVDFRITARRDAKAAKAFLLEAIDRVQLHRPVPICIRKALA